MPGAPRRPAIDIPTVARGLLYVELACFVLITVTTSRRWLRHREAASGWLAATFGLLSGFIGLAQFLPLPPYHGAVLWLVKGFLAGLLLFPYCLYRFMATFGAPRRWVSVTCHVLMAAVLGMTALLPPLPGANAKPPLLLSLYSLMIGVQWVFISGVVVIRLWRAGVGLPTVARRRSQMLAAGAAVLALNVVLSIGTRSHSQVSVTNLVLESISIFSAVLFLFGFRPPQQLLMRWRRGDDEALRQAMMSLVQATTSNEVVDGLLPRIAQLVGASGAALMGPDGELLGQYGNADPTHLTRDPASDPPATRPEAAVAQVGPRHLRVDLPRGALHIWSTPYTPFFGREQLELLQSLGSLLHLTLDRTQAQERAAQSASDLAEAQQLAAMGSWRWEPATGEITWSPEMYRLYGVDPGLPLSVGSYDGKGHPDDAELAASTIRAALEQRSDFDTEWRIINADGSVRWLHVRGRVFEEGDRLLLRGTSQDITERHELETRLLDQALHDDLTGLPNRRLFVTRLTEALSAAAARGETVAVLFIDVDRFKLINDGLGHEAGDDLLGVLGERLTSIMRPDDVVARFGGDEFVVLCQHLEDVEDAMVVTRRIQRMAAEPVTLRGVEMIVTLSIGISVSDLTGHEASAMLRDADAAMYRAKQDGRARHAIFAEDMRAQALSRLDTERELRRALLDEQLEVHYQPIFDLATGGLDSLEALVRWRHPTRGLLGPAEFISVAEETGLIVPLGEYVLETACRQLRMWQLSAPGFAHLGLAVNLSGVQVALPDLTERIRRILRRTAVDASDLELEITESVLMQDAEETMTVLRSLKSLGVRLSVDDFGTGYSSLSYLKRFPVDTLKVDRSFVDGLGVEAEDSAIVQSILALAAALGMLTIGEGVETPRQLATLTELGCAKAQGYHLSRPVSACVISELLAGMDSSPTVPRPRVERLDQAVS